MSELLGDAGEDRPAGNRSQMTLKWSDELN